MCIIIDANKCNELANGDSDLQPIIEWIASGKGNIVFANTDRFQTEFRGCSVDFKTLWRTYDQAGQVNHMNSIDVEKEMKTLKNLKSNDDHIIALALVSGAKILVSGDKNLHEDFKNKENGVGGKVYQYKKQKHLLTQNPCP